jgi:putative ABC transport system permease protein
MGNNFKMALRRLSRDKTFTILNLAGLVIGIAAALQVYFIVSYELSIDRFHPNADRIFRVVSTETYRNGFVDFDGCSPLPLAPALRKEFPEPEIVAPVFRAGTNDFTLSGTSKRFQTDNTYYAGPELFGIFDFPWLAGDPKTGLSKPNTAALTRSIAKAWFGDWKRAMGKTILEGDQKTPYEVTGIIDDLPENTDIPLRVVLSYETFRGFIKDQLANPRAWDDFGTNSQCFFVLPPNVSIRAMESRLPAFVALHYTPLFAGSDTRDSSYFQPLKEMHFDQEFSRYGPTGWSYSQLWAIGLIGVFILLMACINFINLSTAQGMNRGKEIGMRKVLGVSKGRLLRYSLTETGLLVGVSTVLGLLLAYETLPVLSRILGRPVLAGVLNPWQLFGFIILISLLVTWIAGFYPGLILSRLQPIAALKNKLTVQRAGRFTLRRTLIVGQFVIAQVLIICTLVIGSQMDFFARRPMGFDKNSILLVNIPSGADQKTNAAYFKSLALQIPGVLSATLCSNPPSTSSAGSSNFTLDNHAHPEDFEPTFRFADSDYLKTFHLSLVAGRYPYPSDTIREVLMNENSVRRLGFSSPEQIIGHRFRWGGQSSPAGLPVVGVIHDFNDGSLKEKAGPVMLATLANQYQKLAVKVDPRRTQAVLSRLGGTFHSVYPQNFYNSEWFDEMIAGYYDSEATASRLFRIFAALAIFISCLGVYGLVAFMVVRKTKEVGIRKVLGASTGSILTIFSREFTGLIGLAFLIATPTGIWLMSRWLLSFSYHVGIGWWIPGCAILLSLVIAWATIGLKAVRAALANPVTSLRSE